MRAHTTRAPAPLSPKEFMDLARAMGIPAHDAARQVLELIADRTRGGDLG